MGQETIQEQQIHGEHLQVVMIVIYYYFLDMEVAMMEEDMLIKLHCFIFVL